MRMLFPENYPFSNVNENIVISENFSKKIGKNGFSQQPRKVKGLKNLQKLFIIVNNSTFFSLFGFSFFTNLISAGSGSTNFEYTSAGTYCSLIPTLMECQKAQLVLDFLDVATHFSPKKQGSTLPSRSQSKTFHFYISNPLENHWCFFFALES